MKNEWSCLKKTHGNRIIPRSIEQQYERVMNLNRYQRKSRQEKKRSREKGEVRNLRMNILTNTKGTNRQ